MSTAKLQSLLTPGALRILFQPVFEMHGGPRVHYFEGLSRAVAGGSFERAEVLFDYVRLLRAESAMDRACAAAVCAAARELPAGSHFGLNVHASTLSRDEGFGEVLAGQLAANALWPQQLVLEIVEHAPHLTDARLRGAVDALCDLGIRIALDDVGSGHSNYRMMIELRPQYLKIDRAIVQGCHSDRFRRAVVESISLLARRFGAQAIVEGVEAPADLLAVQEVGVDLVQGYLLATPAPAGDLRFLGGHSRGRRHEALGLVGPGIERSS